MKYAPIVFAYSCLFCLGFLDNSRGPLYPSLLEYFSISSSVGSLFFSTSALAAFLMAIGASQLIKKFALLRPSQFGLLFFSISAMILSQLPPTKVGVIFLMVSSLFLGLGVGVHSVTLNLIINQNTPVDIKRRVFAGLHSMYGMASFLAPMAMGFAFKQGLDWKKYFFVVGCIYFLFFISSLIIFAGSKKKEVEQALSHKIKRSVLPMAIMFSCYVCSEVIFSSRLVFYLTSVHEFSKPQAANYLSIFFSLLLLGRLSFAFFPIPFGSKNLLKISAILSMALIFIGVLYNPIVLPAVGLTMSYFFPCAMDYVADYFGVEDLDQGFAKVMIGVGGALVFFHVAFGQIANLFGVQFSIWIIPVLLGVVLYILQVTKLSLAKHVKTATTA